MKSIKGNIISSEMKFAKEAMLMRLSISTFFLSWRILERGKGWQFFLTYYLKLKALLRI